MSAPPAAAANTAPDSPTEPQRHSLFEDAQALITGTLFVALGLMLFRQAGLMTGGTVGLAFLAHYASGLAFGPLFFLINLPFYWLAWRRLGPAFTLKSFAAVALVSLCTTLAPRVIRFDQLNAWVAAVLGGLLIGFGLLALLRHRASVGGVNILAQTLQEQRGWSAGKVQMAVDCSVLLAALWVVEPLRLLQSVLGAVALSAILVLNHRPGRYLGV